MVWEKWGRWPKIEPRINESNILDSITCVNYSKYDDGMTSPFLDSRSNLPSFSNPNALDVFSPLLLCLGGMLDPFYH